MIGIDFGHAFGSATQVGLLLSFSVTWDPETTFWFQHIPGFFHSYLIAILLLNPDTQTMFDSNGILSSLTMSVRV